MTPEERCYEEYAQRQTEQLKLSIAQARKEAQESMRCRPLYRYNWTRSGWELVDEFHFYHRSGKAGEPLGSTIQFRPKQKETD